MPFRFSSISKTSGQSSAQVPQPTQHSSSKTTRRPIVKLSFLLLIDPFRPLLDRWGYSHQEAKIRLGPQTMWFTDLGD